MIDIKENYRKSLEKLKSNLDLKSIYELPAISKVVVAAGIGKIRDRQDSLSAISQALAAITGQRPVTTVSRQAIAGFKLQRHEIIGLKVTLRGRRMDDFLNRLVNVTLPRIREFRGIDERQLDAQGNLTLGFRDAQPFAELTEGAGDLPFSIGVTVNINRSNPKKSLTLLRELGFPVKLS